MDKDTRILIVEKDITVQEEVLCRLIEMGYEIVQTVFTGEDALAVLNKRSVDIVLIDTRLTGEINSFRLANTIKLDYQLPFIFLDTTGKQHIINKARQTNPGAILVKPCNYKQLQVSIEICIENYSRPLYVNKSQNGDPTTNPSMTSLDQSLFLKKDKHFERVDLDDIFWLKAESNYTLIHTLKGGYMYSTVLKNFEKKLPADQFIRVHRSYIINLAKIEGFEGKMVIIDNKRIPVNKNCRDRVFKILQVV